MWLFFYKKDFMKFSFLLLFFFCSSCSHLNRNIASLKDYQNKSFEEINQKIQKIINTGYQDRKECVQEYNSIYNSIFHSEILETYFNEENITVIEKDIRNSFLMRIYIKNSFKNFNIANKIDEECFFNAKEVFKALRYAEDYFIEAYKEKIKESGLKKEAFEGKFPFLLVNPKFKFENYHNLKSGDVILSRGNAYSSAAIARIGKSDYQFSHVSLIHKNKNQELETIQALIEVGSAVTSYSSFINEFNNRAVIFRYNEGEEIAKTASEIMYQKIMKYQITQKLIPYDFSMNYKNSEKLFCSEIISLGFKLAENSKDFLPKYKTQLESEMIPFLNNLGVPVNVQNINEYDVFAPGDIQFEQKFDLVAEWRNPNRLEESRFKDFILTKIFEKMKTDHYKFDPSFKMDAKSKAIWTLRRTPMVSMLLKKVPLTLNSTQMETFMALEKVGEVLYDYLEKRSNAYEFAMTPKQILIELEMYFKIDYNLYLKNLKNKTSMNSTFHEIFHP